ncbi:TonB-dependent siderophore receptor [Rugamonas sp. CCM 8940]|uniref:TonB-dependent siderophore receptor n=1 Tax=Rugamonas sp. CCM 8940 TaxID=2765359 RepID=UPI0018F39117|nr:TonB-dependent siderophore receptor [Rugamonas sp. CCM 8940]MBJ7312506.1 TonB-dependent siderophore receptor [Rugamonas sp. CCM 8940]
MNRTNLAPTAIALACGFGAASGAWAEQVDGQGNAAANGGGQTAVEAAQARVVVVGGRKPLYEVRDVNLGALGSKDALDVPLSIQSYSSALIENQGARTLNDVLKNDASVQNASLGGAFDHISIRGFAVDWANTMRRDGLSLAPYQDVPLENVEHIDVLKGPSGFLYGYNSPGGTVNYVLKRPTAKSFVSLGGELRNHQGRYAHLDAGGKFGDDSAVGYRVNLAREKVGDFHHSDDLSRSFASAAFDWKPSQQALLRLDVDYQQKEVAAQPLIGPQANGQLPPLVDGRVLLGQPWLQYETRTSNIGGRFDYALNDNWSLTAQLNRSQNTRLAAFPDVYSVRANGDVLSGDLYISPDQQFKATSGQVFVSGGFASGPLRHELVAGLSARDYSARDGGFIVLPDTVGNIFHPVYSARPVLPPAPPKNLTENRQTSLFVSDLLTLNSSWQAIVGLRFIRYTNEFTKPGQAGTVYQQNSSVPSAGLMYKPDRRVTAYASYSQGLEQGGVAPFNAANAGVAMEPIKSRQVELGVKAEVLDGLLLGAALFEVEKGLEYLNSHKVYVQDGRQRHRGVEFSANGQLSKHLSLVAGLALLDSAQVATGDPLTSGKRAPNVPRRQASVFADYRVAVLDGLFLNGGAYFVAARPLDSVNSVDLPGYARVDLGLRYQAWIGGRRATLRLNVENLADRRYWNAATFASVYPGKPRSIAASAQFEL